MFKLLLENLNWSEKGSLLKHNFPADYAIEAQWLENWRRCTQLEKHVIGVSEIRNGPEDAPPFPLSPQRSSATASSTNRPTAFQFSVCTLKLCNSWRYTLQSAPFIAHVCLNECASSRYSIPSTAFEQTPQIIRLYLLVYFPSSISVLRIRALTSDAVPETICVFKWDYGGDGMQLFSLVIALQVQKCVDERRPAAATAVSCITWMEQTQLVRCSIWKVSKTTKASAVQRLLQFGVRKNGSDYKPNPFWKAPCIKAQIGSAAFFHNFNRVKDLSPYFRTFTLQICTSEEALLVRPLKWKPQINSMHDV